MANYIIPSSNTEYDIADDDSTYTLEADSVLSVNNAYGIFGGPGYSNDRVMVQGDILQSGAGFVAVNLAGDDMYSKVFAGSLVNGYGGYTFLGDDATLFNKGTIRGTDAAAVYYDGINAQITNGTGAKIFGNTNSGTGIEAMGASGEINNNGRISAYYGIHTYNDNTTINILDQGSVKGTFAAIYSNTDETARKLVVRNDGVIDGGDTGYAILTADGKDTIINTGKIFGMIELGSGKDVFDNRGGTVDNKIYGGTGDDMLITDNNKTKLFENGGSAGFDTVRSSSNYYLSANVEKLVLFGNKDISGQGTSDGNELYGNSHKNKLFGLDGADILDGGKGADKLQGGDDFDTFVFKTGYGKDIVFDFVSGSDQIDIKDWAAITSYNDLISNHAEEKNGSVIIKAGNDWLTLKSTTIEDLDSVDFLIL